MGKTQSLAAGAKRAERKARKPPGSNMGRTPQVNTAVKTETAICNSFHVQVASNGIFHFLHRNFNSHFSSDRCAMSILKTHGKSSAMEHCHVLFKLGTCVENPVLLYNYLFKLFLCCWIGHNTPLGFGGRIISCLLFFFGSDIS